MRSFLSILILASMLLTLAACSGGTDMPNDGTGPSYTTTSDPENTLDYEKDDIPDDLDFGGQVINFALAGQGTANIRTNEIFTDELNSDIVNDSIYNRQKYVEERLGVEINPVFIGPLDYEAELERQHMSDEDMYQLCGYITFAFTRFVFTDYLYDLTTLNYLDLEKPWWSQTFNAEAEIMDGQYVATGSLALSLSRSMFAIFYNKKLADSHSATFPELNELYDIVDRGDWTYDKFYELGSSIYTDNNGNDTRDEEDYYGIGFQECIGADVIWSSFDIDILSPDGDGWFELDVPVEKMYDVLGKIHTLLNNTPGCFNPGGDDEDLKVLSEMMAGDNLLFMNNKLDAVESPTLRNMQSDYGILPFPKYNSAQKEYYTYAHDSYTSFAIPKTNLAPDVSAAVLEALASYAYRETNPSYFNVALKGKYMNDPQSRKMLDLVVDGFKVDAAWIYLETLGAGFPANFRPSDDTSYAGKYASQSKKVETNLKMYKVASKFS